MKKLLFVLALSCMPTAAFAWPWSQDMANQISVKPEESVNPATPAMKEFPKRSVPVPGTMTRVADLSAAETLQNPVVADAKSVEVGRRLFQIYCVACHGAAGKGDGLVGAKLLLQPYDLTAAQTRDRTDGFIWGYMTLGGAVMPTYANDLSPKERWHVVNYVRKVLQGAKLDAASASSN